MTIISLPNLDYTKYNCTSGMSTKHWGPSYWVLLFTSVMGTYPVSIDVDNDVHVNMMKQFSNIIYSLEYILPCIFCRESVRGFISDLPPEPYLASGRIELMFWFYLIKNKVNTKLLRQERVTFKNQTKGDLTPEEYSKAVENCFHTKETPPFKEVLDYYESLRAQCSKETKRCVIGLKTENNND